MVYVDILATKILSRKAFQGSALMCVFSLSLGNNGLQHAVKALHQGSVLCGRIVESRGGDNAEV